MVHDINELGEETVVSEKSKVDPSIRYSECYVLLHVWGTYVKL